MFINDFGTDGRQTAEIILFNGMYMHVLKMENRFLDLANLKKFDYTCLTVGLSQNVKQNVELRFSKGSLFHTEGWIFGLSSSFDYQFNSNPKTFESETRCDHIKSSKINIEHSRGFADQWNPSSSEDG
jgi:hypothetical protein